MKYFILCAFCFLSFSVHAVERCTSVLGHPALAQAQTKFQVNLLQHEGREVLIVSADQARQFTESLHLVTPLTELVDDVAVTGASTRRIRPTVEIDTALKESKTAFVGQIRLWSIVGAALLAAYGGASYGMEQYLIQSDPFLAEMIRGSTAELCRVDPEAFKQLYPELHPKIMQIDHLQQAKPLALAGIYGGLSLLDYFIPSKHGSFLEKLRLRYALFTLPDQIMARNISNLLQTETHSLLVVIDNAHVPELLHSLQNLGFKKLETYCPATTPTP